MAVRLQSFPKTIGFLEAITNINDENLKSTYQRFLVKESVFLKSIKDVDLRITDFNGLRNFAPTFCRKKAKYFSTNTAFLSERLATRFFENALYKLKIKNNEIYLLSQLIVKVILLNNLTEYTNGTTDETIGLATMDFKDHFNEEDFIELLFHQLTHMLLFIDDRNNPHMSCFAKVTWIETSLKYVLGGHAFPAYLAFHSYLVGVEMLFFRKKMNGLEFSGHYHGSSMRIIDACEAFQISLMKHLNLFLPRGLSILEMAADKFKIIRNSDGNG